MTKGKKLVYVPADLLQEAMQASNRVGESVGRFVEDAIKQAIIINEMGYDPKKAAEFFEVLQAQRVLGGSFVPLEVFNYLIKKAYGDEREELHAKWYDSGVWHGKYIKEKFKDPIQSLKRFIEASRWELQEVDLKRNGGVIKLRCVSTVLEREGTELLARFIEGIAKGIGFETIKTDSFKGMVVFEFKPSN